MRKTKKAIASLVIMGMCVTLVPFNVFAATGVTTDRIQGTDRFGTAVNVAERFSSATTAILAPSANNHLVDALAAAPLAGMNSPILLTESNTLNAAAKAELIKLKITKVFVVGAIDQAVVDQVKAISTVTEVTPIKGANRIQTAAMISSQLTRPAGTFVVGYDGLADALSVSSYASAHNYSILVTNPDGTLPASSSIVGKGYTVGGINRVDPIAGIESLAGADRYATNKVVLEKLTYSYNKAYVANGTNEHYVDALVAAKVAAPALTPANFVDFSAVTTALAMAEETNTKKIAKTVVINHAIGALVLIVDANLAAAKVAAGALTPGNFVDYSAVTTALAMAEGTNTEKIAKTVAINHALGALVTLVDANLAAAKVAAGALTPADYVNYSAVTTALAMAEGTDAQKIAKTVAINHAIGALVTFLEAVNTASAETMGSVITSAGLSLTTTTLADYKLLTPASQAVVHAALAGKAFTNNAAVNLAFETAVSVLIINEIPLTSPVAAGNAQMESALARYKTILGLEAIPYATYITLVSVNPIKLIFQSNFI